MPAIKSWYELHLKMVVAVEVEMVVVEMVDDYDAGSTSLICD